MKTTQDVRDYAAHQGVDEREAVRLGLEEKAQEFRARGGEVFVPVEVV